MITLKTLEWDNCFSYGSGNKIDLTSAPVTQIIGANGHGKSSIPLIIEELFYNKNSKNVKKSSIPNRNLDGTYRIKGIFTKDNDEYELEVTRKATAKVVLLKNEEDISSHTATATYKTVEELLGMDFKTFSQLIYQNTNSSLQFLTATDTSRKKFLIDLLHLEHYTELFEIFKEASKGYSTKLTEVQSRIATIENWLNNNILSDATLQDQLPIEISTEEDEKESALLQNEIDNIAQKNKKIQNNNQYKKLLAQIDINSVNSISVSKLDSYDELQSEIGKLSNIASTATNTFKKLQGLGDKCPTCLQDVESNFKRSLLEREKETALSARASIEKLQAEIDRIKDSNVLYEKKVKTQREWEDLWGRIDHELSSVLLDKEELEQKLSLVQKRLSEKRKQIEAIIKHNTEISKRNTRIQVILEQTADFLEKLEKNKKELNELSDISSRLEVLKKAFSTNGLVAYKIENMVEELESITNQYLAEFSEGRFTIEFVIVNDKLNVSITDHGLEIEIESLSSGELARVTTSSLLAIRRLMSSISKSRINILFLDEVISTLDDFGKEKLVEVLLQEEGLNTFLVSHGWTHPLLDKLSVIKENKVSRIE
jgi:DNA repair exonuclease SbcCD ATPase subunit